MRGCRTSLNGRVYIESGAPRSGVPVGKISSREPSDQPSHDLALGPPVVGCTTVSPDLERRSIVAPRYGASAGVGEGPTNTIPLSPLHGVWFPTCVERKRCLLRFSTEPSLDLPLSPQQNAILDVILSFSALSKKQTFLRGPLRAMVARIGRFYNISCRGGIHMDLSRPPTLRQLARVHLQFPPHLSQRIFELSGGAGSYSTFHGVHGDVCGPGYPLAASRTFVATFRGRSASLSHLRHSKDLNCYLPQSYRLSRTVHPRPMDVITHMRPEIVQAVSRICEWLVFGLGCSLSYLPCELENLGQIV
jgi:hypothetical protein